MRYFWSWWITSGSKFLDKQDHLDLQLFGSLFISPLKQGNYKSSLAEIERVKKYKLFAQKLIEQINEGKKGSKLSYTRWFFGVSFLKTIENCVARGGLSSKLRGMVATGCIRNVNRKIIIIYGGKIHYICHQRCAPLLIISVGSCTR